jgi:REP element-mobilizing transposase RayT
MPRASRLLVDDQPAVYHVMSRTALDGFPLGDVEKDRLVDLIRHFSSIYFAEILGFCVMGNHFHILVRMLPAGQFDDADLERRFKLRYGPGARLTPPQAQALRRKWASLSEFMREIKQTFSRFYNKLHDRRGFFWGERFKSVIVEDGRTLVNCLAYIDLNPVRAGIAARPEDYRWCSLARHVQAGNRDGFLSTDFGLAEWGFAAAERLRAYREFLYETGALDSGKGASIAADIVDAERKRNYESTAADRLLQRCRYFTDSGVIGSKRFVQDMARRFGVATTTARTPKKISGIEQSYSLKRLS